MKTHAQVVVIGGGVVGASVLYHLTKKGWKDVVLVERDELTSGSTWHAAGGMHTINADPNVAKLQSYTINLYQEIEAISGQSCGVHITGGVMLAGTESRLDWLRATHAKGRYLGMETELISVDEAAERFPLMDKKHFVGAMYDPVEGHVDPSGVTQAYAKSARVAGAEVYRHTKVESLKQTADGGWEVITDKGTIQAEHVVNAGGLWAREVGRMVGIELPVLAMEHQYIVTDEMPEVVEYEGKEMLHAIDFEGEIYMRQEGKGMLMGTYERAGVPWSEKTTPWDFGHELLQEDLDRIAPSLEVGFEHFPALGRVGLKRVVNGPFTFAPDGNPLVGPVRGLSNYWCACGVMAGFSQGGGVGLALSNWIVDNDPDMNVMAMDVSRFGPYADRAYTNAKVRENYSRRFRITFPNEELPAARPLRTTPVYERFKRMNAVFGVAYGLEYALWFAPEGVEPVEEPTFKRSNAFDHVGEECRAVREGCGIVETSTFAKYEVTGSAAESWLNHVFANQTPAVGRMTLSPMLNDKGKLIGDFTIAHTREGVFNLFSSGVAENYHLRWLEAHLPVSGVQLRSLRESLVGFSICGPKSRELLARLTDEDVSNASMPFMSFKEMHLGMVPVKIGRVTFTGDLGYEMWVSPDYQLALHDLLIRHGEDLGLRHFGARALNSLRLEKSFGSWTREYTPDYSPIEAGLSRFVNMKKDSFVGKQSLEQELDTGSKLRLVTFDVDADGVDVLGDEPIWANGEVVGWVTSGGYAHYVGKSVSLGYINADVDNRADFEIEILGDKRGATFVNAPMFDPQGSRMRA